jgi:HEAT repeat protein
MPSVFISYSHDPADPTHADRVAGLAASLWRDGLKVFFDQKRGVDEEKLPWPIWMEGKIEEADHVLLVCTELYLKKVRQQVSEDEGQGVCWEANIIYALLYERKLNTTKFSPVVFSPVDRRFIPTLLKGRDCFMVDSQSGYNRLYAFLTNQHRIHFPEQGAALRTVAQKTVQALFALPGEDAPARTDSVPASEKLIPAATPQLTLKPNIPPIPRHDIRGLDWYDECDAGHFIGRSDDANQILGKLMPHPILRLVGPSGVGKSSLIRAGLLPKIRESGWRACVIRPFEDPARRIPSQLTAELLVSPGAFTTPLDPAKFRAEVSPLLSRNGVNSLVLFFDQFEDIVSPMAASEAVDAMREFLRELWEQKEIKPYLRAVVVYRTDADMRLGRLWQEVSGRSEGLPYLALEGLSRGAAKAIVSQTAQEQGWRLETSVLDIARQLALESEKLDCSGEVFPVYLQIFLQQAERTCEGHVTAEFIAGLGGVAGLIGKYLEQTLGRLKARGGDWQQCGAVLESLSQSAGTKAVQSLNDLVRETGVNRAVLAEMLRELINERLVRPVGRETYEIQHDRLAAAVIESMKDSDREAKAAREFLAAKVPAFEQTMVPLVPRELVYLYFRRRRIHPTERELRLLLASMLHNIEAGQRNESPGAYWFALRSPKDLMHWHIQIEHWAAKEGSSFRPSRAWVETLPLCGLEPQFATLAADPLPKVREICIQWIGRTKRDEYLPLLRGLTKDEDPGVRAAAVKAVASFSRAGDLPLLCNLAHDQYPNVRAAAVKALASLSRPEALPLLRELAKDQDENSEVRVEAVKALASLSRPEALPLLRELAKDQDEKSEVRAEAVKARASFLTALASLSRPEALPLLRELVKDQDWQVRTAAAEAWASFSQAEDLPQLRELAKDQNPEVRAGAVKALVSFSKEEALPLLRKLAKDQNSKVRAEAVKARASFWKEEDLPLLRELAENGDENSDVRAAAVEALASFSRAEDLPLLRGLIKDQDWRVRAGAAKALARWLEKLASASKDRDLPLLRRLVKDEDPVMRAAALVALAIVSKEEALPLLRKLIEKRGSVVEKLGSVVEKRSSVVQAFLAFFSEAVGRDALASFSGAKGLPFPERRQYQKQDYPGRARQQFWQEDDPGPNAALEALAS